MNHEPQLRRACKIAAFMLPTCLAQVAMGQAEFPARLAHTAALQACPTVHDEIVDLDMLAAGLKDTSAVSLLEKVRLKSSIDELIGRLKALHGGSRSFTLTQLQEQYDVLMMRIASDLQDKDAALHGRLCNAWDSIWSQLADRGRFAEKFS